MTKKLFSLLTVLIVVFGFIGCPEPGDGVKTSPAMQVYNPDKTNPYDGEDLDFYIQNDSSETLAATIRNGKLVIRYIPLPVSYEYTDISSATEISPQDLKRFEIILVSSDGEKRLKYPNKSSSVANIYFYNKDGSFKLLTKFHSVKQGWNITQAASGSSTNPADIIFENFCWVIESL